MTSSDSMSPECQAEVALALETPDAVQAVNFNQCGACSVTGCKNVPVGQFCAIGSFCQNPYGRFCSDGLSKCQCWSGPLP